VFFSAEPANVGEISLFCIRRTLQRSPPSEVSPAAEPNLSVLRSLISHCICHSPILPPELFPPLIIRASGVLGPKKFFDPYPLIPFAVNWDRCPFLNQSLAGSSTTTFGWSYFSSDTLNLFFPWRVIPNHPFRPFRFAVLQIRQVRHPLPLFLFFRSEISTPSPNTSASKFTQSRRIESFPRLPAQSSKGFFKENNTRPYHSGVRLLLPTPVLRATTMHFF